LCFSKKKKKKDRDQSQGPDKRADPATLAERALEIKKHVARLIGVRAKKAEAATIAATKKRAELLLGHSGMGQHPTLHLPSCHAGRHDDQG
jgi:hypothetical protein